MILQADRVTFADDIISAAVIPVVTSLPAQALVLMLVLPHGQ